MAHSGKYLPKFPRKYKGDWKNIVYRSSWERKMMRFCDLNKSVLKWSSEETVVPYISPIDKKYHRYFVDFWIKLKTKDGEIKEYLIEVKPEKETREPKKRKKITKRYLSEIQTWLVNNAKWKAATEYADEKGMEFKIFTENHLGIR